LLRIAENRDARSLSGRQVVLLRQKTQRPLCYLRQLVEETFELRVRVAQIAIRGLRVVRTQQQPVEVVGHLEVLGLLQKLQVPDKLLSARGNVEGVHTQTQTHTHTQTPKNSKEPLIRQSRFDRYQTFFI
jgi:hypothetical protein